MSTTPLSEMARRLGDAWAGASTVPAPSTLVPALTDSDAYEIQEMVIEERLDGGRRRSGWKLGLTSAGPATTPIVGTLLSDMIVPSGSTLALRTMVAPMVEAEIVIRIGATIEGPRTASELADGPHEAGPGIEVIDYRTVDSAGPIDWIADNSTVAYAVVGDLLPMGETHLPTVETTLWGDGVSLASGRGEVVMGDPLAAVAWLSGHLSARGRHLETGDIILTGSLTGHHTVPPGTGSSFRAEFGELGDVSVRFQP